MITKTEALDTDECAYDNCYDRVYGVVQIPFDIEMFEGDSERLGERKHRIYVNTPLCRAHFRQVPSTAYIWEDMDWNADE